MSSVSHYMHKLEDEVEVLRSALEKVLWASECGRCIDKSFMQDVLQAVDLDEASDVTLGHFKDLPLSIDNRYFGRHSQSYGGM